MLLKRLDRKTNDLKQDVKELHHRVGDVHENILEVVSGASGL